MQHLLETVEFRDRTRALNNLNKIIQEIPSGLQEIMRFLLSASADPDGALHWLECLHAQNPNAFKWLIHSPAHLQILITIFSYSRFLAEEIIQHPEWVKQLSDGNETARLLLSEEIEDKLERELGPDPGPPSVLTLALFRRQQIFRILIRDVLGYATLSETTEELSNLADAILNGTYRRIREDLVRRYGTPRYVDAAGENRECGFSVIALGKLGGRELNYSSDIDLMFVYSANGQTEGPNSISNKEFYKKVATQFTAMLSTYTAEGMCYRVDLRLRPDGRLGEVCMSLDGAEAYYRTRARDWELQMLIKARVCSGEKGPGASLLGLCRAADLLNHAGFLSSRSCLGCA